MSNITPLEIVAIVGQHFGVHPDVMAGRTTSHARAYGPVMIRWARRAAVWALRRHTDLSWHAVAATVGLAKGGNTLDLMRVGVTECDTARLDDPILAAKLEAIEDQIDRVHEARMDAMPINGHQQHEGAMQ